MSSLHHPVCSMVPLLQNAVVLDLRTTSSTSSHALDIGHLKWQLAYIGTKVPLRDTASFQYYVAGGAYDRFHGGIFHLP